MMTPINDTPRCVACGRSSDEVPLLPMRYHDEDLWICSTHLPILIHRPEQLEGKLSGASGIEPGEHD